MQKKVDGQLNLMKSIDRLTDLINDKSIQIIKLKNSNTERIEKISWIREKLVQKKSEIKQLRSQVQTQNKNQVQTNHYTEESLIRQRVTQIILGLNKKDLLMMFDYYLSHLVRSQGPLGATFNENYINYSDCINLRVVTKYLHTETICVIIDESTTFINLVALSIEYFQLAEKFSIQDLTMQEILSKYQIQEENLALVNINDKICESYRQRGRNVTHNHVIVSICEKDMERQIVTQYYQLSTQIGDLKNYILKLPSILEVCHPVKTRYNIYQHFFNKFPGLKAYIFEQTILKLDDQQQQKITQGPPDLDLPSYEIRYELDDRNCCVVLVLFLLLIFNLILYFLKIESFKGFLSIQSLKYQLNIEDYYLIQDLDALYNFLDIGLGAGLLNSEKKLDYFRENYEVIGPIRIRQVRSQNVRCGRYVQDYQKYSCFDRSREERTNINSNDGEEFRYQSPEDLKTVYHAIGQFGEYGDGGYALDIPNDKYYEQYQEDLSKLRDSEYIGESSIAVIITFTIYSPNTNQWIYFTSLIEKNYQNIWVPNIPLIYNFIPNQYESSEGKFMFYVQIFSVFAAVILLMFTFFRAHQLKSYRYFTLETGSLNLILFVMNLLQLSYSIFQSRRNLSSQVLVLSINFIDLYSEASNYNTLQTICALNVFFILLRITLLFNVSEKILLISRTLYKQLLSVLIQIIVQLPIICGFILIFQLLLGRTDPSYTTFGKSLAQYFLFAQGTFSAQRVYDFNLSQSIFCFLCYYFNIFFITSFIQALHIINNRSVLMRYGYPTEQQEPLDIKRKNLEIQKMCSGGSSRGFTAGLIGIMRIKVDSTEQRGATIQHGLENRYMILNCKNTTETFCSRNE